MANYYIKHIFLMILAAILLPAYIFSQGGIKIQSGAQLVISNAAKIILNNAGFTNNGTFASGNGTVSFTGTALTSGSFIAGSSSTNFYNLTLNKSSNGLLLNSNIGVSNNLTFTSGDSIYLNNFIIDLGATGSLSGEANVSRITGLSGGYIQSTQTLNAPVAANPGNLGIEITSLANLGSTVIRRGHLIQPGSSISRYFEIIPTNNSGLNATVTFHYLDNELGVLNENLLQFYKSSNAGINWSAITSDPSNVVLNKVTATGLAQLDMYTLAETGAVLPIRLLSFNAKFFNKQTVLNWSSDNEINLGSYQVERSVDGIHFLALASVTGNGGSNTQYYSYIDNNPVNGVNYYRLKAIDINGKFIYSNVILVKVNAENDFYLSIYPNPAQLDVKIIFSSEKAEQCKLELFNAGGFRIDTKYINAVNGLNNLIMNIQNLPAGIYTIRVTGSNSKSIQFIKK